MIESTRVVYVDPAGSRRQSASASARPRVEDVFADAGMTVSRVESIAACLGGLSDADCVVFEYDLPDGNGVELCERIRSRRPDVPLVAFTDAGTEALAGELVAAGADGYVPKSQGVETLAARVIDLLFDRPEGDRPGGTGAEGPGPDPGEPADLDLFVEQSPLAIIEWNLELEAIGWNPAAAELFGYTESEATGRDALSLLVPDGEWEDVRETWRTVVDDGESVRGIFENVRKDGTVVTCEWFDTPLYDDDGELVSVLSFVQDVTDDVRRADALEKLQETTNDLMRANSREAIADLVVEAAEDVIDRPRATLRFYDEETGTLELASATERLGDDGPGSAPIGPPDGPIWNAYALGEPTVIDDASTDAVPYDLEVGTAVVHPLGDHGALTVASPAETTFGSAERHLVYVLATTAEAALDRAERERRLERTETIVEAVGDGVYALDRDGHFVAVNDTLTSMTGYDREDLVGEHTTTVLTDESDERATARVRELLAADEDAVATYEVTLVTDGGERVPCEVTTTLLGSNGDHDGIVGIVRDVSDRKAMERELREHTRKIETLHEVASRLDACETASAVFEVTVDAAEDVLKFDVCVADSVRGDHFVTEAVSTDMDDDGYADRTPIDDDGLAGKTYRNGQTYRIGDISDREDATPESDDFRSVLSVPIGERGIFQAVSSEPDAFDGHDEDLAELLLSHAADALDRLAFEQQLREERDRFVALFENVPDAVVSAHQLAEGPVVDRINPAFERIFGYEADEIVGEPLDRYIVPQSKTAEAEAVNRRTVEGEVVETEVKRRTTDGLRDFMLRLVPIEPEGQSDRAFGVYTDITEQKQRQKRVEILNRVLRHDLRNGMNIIDGCAEMLADAVEDDASAQYAETIQERASELIGLAEKTRAVERTLDGGDAATGPVDVVGGVEDAIEAIEAEYPDAEITRTIPDRAFARADDLLEAAIRHVLENAVEHNDRQAPAVDVTLEDAGNEDGSLVLTVADDGPGLPDEERELLQEEKEITQLRHASGLGLWLVNWVVTQSGGRLTFEENEPRGTIVRLRVPKAEVGSSGVVSDGATASD